MLQLVVDDRLAHVLSILPDWVGQALSALDPLERAKVEEIRISQGQPLTVSICGEDRFPTSKGASCSPAGGLVVERRHLESVLDAVTNSSVYALEEAMNEGYFSLPGGHRVGIAGQPRVLHGEVRGFGHIAGLTIRINRPVPGAGLPVLPMLLRPGGTIHSTLILSPPGCGKTTLLRDLVRLLSEGRRELGLRPHRVGVADERSEIAGSHLGVPQNDLGPRTDVIDACPKALAIPMLVRAWRPDVIATDEIGHPGDARAAAEARSAGVVLLCTAHGDSLKEARRRPSLRPLLDGGAFGRIVLLSRREGPGTVEAVQKGAEEA